MDTAFWEGLLTGLIVGFAWIKSITEPGWKARVEAAEARATRERNDRLHMIRTLTTEYGIDPADFEDVLVP